MEASDTGSGRTGWRSALRLGRAGALAVALLPLVLVGLRCVASPEVPFLVPRPGAPWIMAPAGVSAQLEQWGKERVPQTVFSRRFTTGGDAGPATLTVSAYGSLRVYLNGQELEEARHDSSRGRARTRVHLGGRLLDAENELRAEVANPRGPALLSLEIAGIAEPLRTDASWSGRRGDRVFARALVADDTRIDPRALAVETPLEAVRAHADSLLLLAVLGGLGFLAARRFPRDPGRRALPLAALAAAFAGWIALFFAKFVRIPPAVGFDARHHLVYARSIAENGALPFATDGWSTYHPPLFYAISAAVLPVGDAALKVLPFLAGLGVVAAAFALVRRLEPAAPGLQALAVLFAATLPVNVYTAAYFSNESLHAALASGALLATVSALFAPATGAAMLAGVGALYGLAALTKFTVLVVVPVALFFLALKLHWVERAPPRRVALGLAAFAGAFLAVAGWYYARNWIHYGVPVVGNWALPGADQVWWQQPGFHTPAYYLGFGEALRHPYLAGFHSFWDGIYATFWGDGYVAGRAEPAGRHSFWNYGFMTAGYWVAVPATALLALGAAASVREALSSGLRDHPRRRLALAFLATTCWAVGVAFFSLTLDLPFFAQAKAAYLLMLAAPLALFFAYGVARADAWLGRRGALLARTLFFAWLALFGGTMFLSFAG